MTFVVDIGNHTLHAGLACGTDIVWHQDVPHDAKSVILRGEPSLRRCGPITGMAISSVVPRLLPNFVRLTREQLGLKPLILTAKLRTGLRLRYHPRSALGTDRLANAIAAFRLYPGNTIVVDIGTATTLEVVTKEGDLLGGAILPGPDTMLRALTLQTAQLPKIELRPPSRAIGSSTPEAIRSGIFHAHFAGIDRLIDRIQRETRRKYTVVATGGLAARYACLIRRVRIINPLLTLQGLSIAFDLNSTGRNHG